MDPHLEQWVSMRASARFLQPRRHLGVAIPKPTKGPRLGGSVSALVGDERGCTATLRGTRLVVQSLCGLGLVGRGPL